MARSRCPSQAARCGIDVARGVLLLALLTVPGGCARLRSQVALRSSECTQLCEESRLAREQGRLSQADELLDAAVQKRPKDIETQLNLVDELWTGGRQLAAAEALAKIVAERPDDAPLALRLAQMEADIGRTEAAQTALATAMRLDPEHPEALRLKGRLEEQRGDEAAALATYHHLLRIAPDDFQAQVRLATLHQRRGQPDRAAPLLRAALEHPAAPVAQRPDIEWQLGLVYAQLERWHDAVPAMDGSIRQRRATAEDWYRLAYVQSQIGQQETAYGSLSQALQIEPQHVAARDLARQMKLGTDSTMTAVLPAGFQPRGVQTALAPQ
jgi:tetratricopeptide (TPR) repeat protein